MTSKKKCIVIATILPLLGVTSILAFLQIWNVQDWADAQRSVDADPYALDFWFWLGFAYLLAVVVLFAAVRVAFEYFVEALQSFLYERREARYREGYSWSWDSDSDG